MERSYGHQRQNLRKLRQKQNEATSMRKRFLFACILLLLRFPGCQARHQYGIWRFLVTRFNDVYTAAKFAPADLRDREGNVIVAAGGVCLKPEEIEAMDYYLEGAEPVA